MGGNCWSRGPESQKASAIWLGGVSAVISASDLDEHSFGVARYKSNEHEGLSELSNWITQSFLLTPLENKLT